MKQVFEIEWDGGTVTANLVRDLLWGYLSKFGGREVSLSVKERIVALGGQPDPPPPDEDTKSS